MVQAATTLPVFLFALPAGALGDLFDRRKLLICTQVFLAAVLLLFTALLRSGSVNAWTLLLFTFIIGTGSAFAMPAWQAIVPRLVPRDTLSSAIVLNGVSMNIARAIGPTLGGFILAAAGAVATAFLDAISYLAVAAALLWWRASTTQDDALPRERLAGAMRAGIRFALHSKPLRHTGYWCRFRRVSTPRHEKTLQCKHNHDSSNNGNRAEFHVVCLWRTCDDRHDRGIYRWRVMDHGGFVVECFRANGATGLGSCPRTRHFPDGGFWCDGSGIAQLGASS